LKYIAVMTIFESAIAPQFWAWRWVTAALNITVFCDYLWPP